MKKMSGKYASNDWVAPGEVVDCDGQRVKKNKPKPCRSNDPNNCHREIEEYHFTCGYIICWIGNLIYYISLGTSKLP